MSFVHLHNHTHYSFLDGACKCPELVAEVKRLGMDAIAITDHGNMCGAVDFYDTCKKEGVKPVIGAELYLADGTRFDRGKNSLGKYRPIYHQVFIVKDQTGWKNLTKMSSMAFLEGFYRKPQIDYDLIEKHHEGLICLSGCIQGHVSQELIKGNKEKAYEIAGKMKELFGDDYYLELQNHGIEEEVRILGDLIELSKKLEIKVVATNDTHYVKKEHADSHDILLCVQTKSDLQDPKRFRFPGDHFYLKSEEEMRELFKDYPESITNTEEVAEKTDFDFVFNNKQYPEFKIPEDVDAKDDFDYLEQLCEEGLVNRYPEELRDKYRERMNYELNIIKMKHLASYFLIVRDFIIFSKENDIPVGPGRGSAAGSIVSYLVDITNIDPMRYNLLFERFINPERESYPDIDVDFSDARRCEVIDYCRRKYGNECVTQIITFGKMLSKAVIKDVGRAMQIPLSEVEAMGKLIPDPVGGKAPKLKDAIAETKELEDLIKSKPEYKVLMDRALVLEGTIRNSGMHAAGVVITPIPIYDIVPVYKPGTKDTDPIVTQYDMGNVERLGLLKVDFLGLKTLSILENAIKLIKKRNIKLELDDIPVDDEETYELFGNGDTIGIFQFESSGMRENLRKLQPERLEDLIAMNALYRPGPMDNIETFVKRRHGKEEIEYLDPMLGEILDETYGIIVYQEQVMQIANRLAGMSLGRADLLRRAMGKKKASLMAEMMPEFTHGCGKNGISEDTAKAIWDLIEKFAKYGFNKSHAAAYSLLAYQTGYLKRHYPAEFMAASMTTRKDHTEELVLFLEECKKMGVKVVPPDVNLCDVDFTVDGAGRVLYGLTAIKGVGKAPVENILEVREKGIEFKTIFDLAEQMNSRVVNRKVLENLIYAGAMDSMEGTRTQKLEVLDQAIQYGQQAQKEKANGQESFFGGGEDAVELPKPPLPEVTEMSKNQLLAEERDRLGFYFSGHPLTPFKREIKSFSTYTIAKLAEGETDETVRIAGMLSGIVRKQTKTGKVMGRGKLEDLSGSVPLVIFPKAYEQLKEKLINDEVVLLTGKLQLKDEDCEIFVDDVEPLEEAKARLVSGLRLLVDERMNGHAVISLEEEFRRNPGEAIVRFVFKTEDGAMFSMASRRYKVKPSQQLIERAEELLGEEAVLLDAVG